MAPPARVVDVHTHVLPVRLSEAADRGATLYGVDFAREDSGRLVYRLGGRWASLQQADVYGETPAERVGSMDEQRVDVQIVSLSPSMHLYSLEPRAATAFARDMNDDVAALVSTHPRRFRALAFLPLQSTAAAVQELERVMSDGRFVGAMVGTNVDGRDWDHPALLPVLEAAESLQALLFVHPAKVRPLDVFERHHLRNLVGNPFETTIAIASLVFGGVVDRFPAVRLCFAHGGGYAGFGMGRLDHGGRVRFQAAPGELPSDYLRRLYFDSLTHDERALRYVIDQVGADRVVLGTDYPADMGQERPVDWIEGCSSITDEERALVLGANLDRIVGHRLPS